jgi:chitinase
MKIKTITLLRSALPLFVFLELIFGQRVVGYYPQWVQSEFPANNIDLSVVTHVNHAFAWPNQNGDVLFYDDMLDPSINQAIHDQGRKILLSLGGWGNDVGFATVAASAELRTLFIENLINVCETYNYDGVDLDWEHPASTIDRQNLNFLVAEMDSTFNVYDPELLITMAVPISNWFGQWYDFSFLRFYVDFFNAMTYDIHGGWSDHVGHNSPLYQSPPGDPDGSCSTGISYLSNTRGIPDNQLNLGLPFW